jgi:hypothetical protein
MNQTRVRWAYPCSDGDTLFLLEILEGTEVKLQVIKVSVNGRRSGRRKVLDLKPKTWNTKTIEDNWTTTEVVI